MTAMHRYYAGGLEPLGDREVGVIAATSQLARDGHVLVPSGIDLSAYRGNPIVLWQHDVAMPVGVSTAIGVDGNGDLAARIAFAPEGTSSVADEVCALVKGGIVRGVSVGFDPKDVEPLDPGKPRGGQRITAAELLEISFCSVPVDTGASVVARSLGRPDILAKIRGLEPIPLASVTRAARKLPQQRDGHVISPTMHVWALQQIKRQNEALFGYEARQADLKRLRPGGSDAEPDMSRSAIVTKNSWGNHG